MDWNRIFHRGLLPLEDCPEKWDIIRKRNAELLSLEPVSLDYLKKVIFRCEADRKRAINLFGDDERFLVDSNLFNGHNNYIIDYEIKVNRNRLNKKDLEVSIEFNKNTFKDYKHKYKIIDIENKQCIIGKIAFKDSLILKRKVKISDLPDKNLKFEYYMNGILCIEEFV